MNKPLMTALASLVIAGTALAQRDPATPQPGAVTTPPGKDTYTTRTTDSQQPLRASKIMGARIKNTQGEQIGTLEDVIVNPQSGRVEFAIISSTSASTTTDRTTGIDRAAGGDKLFPVPWKLLNASGATQRGILGTEQVTLTANIERQKLQQAPSFDRSRWPDMSQAQWSQQVYAHYGIEPETGTGGTGTGTATDTGAAGKPPGAPGTDSAPDKNKESKDKNN